MPDSHLVLISCDTPLGDLWDTANLVASCRFALGGRSQARETGIEEEEEE